MIYEFTLNVTPIGKPRMTQRDRWKKRPAVLRYHAFKDEFNRQLNEQGLAAITQEEAVIFLSWVAYLPVPKSWTKKKKAELMGNFHQSRPDRDNIDKAILDTLFQEDSRVAAGWIEKRWDDGKGPRIEFKIETADKQKAA